MTEDEALDRVHEIGTAFENDHNDGDGPDYESVVVKIRNGHAFLEYAGTTNGKTEYFRWILLQVAESPDKFNPRGDED